MREEREGGVTPLKHGPEVVLDHVDHNPRARGEDVVAFGVVKVERELRCALRAEERKRKRKREI